MRILHFRTVWLTIGISSTILFFLVSAVVFFMMLPSWLIVEQNPEAVDGIVVLGGGDGSRLERALSFYEAGLSKTLILVGDKNSTWERVADNRCGNCNLIDKNVVFIEGSVNTKTDAVLVKKYCIENKIKTLMVVTEPYHTKRAAVIMAIETGNHLDTVNVISSGNFGRYKSPDDQWWNDDKTLEKIWLEFGKILGYYLRLLGEEVS